MMFPMSELGAPLYFNLIVFALAMVGVYVLIKNLKKQ